MRINISQNKEIESEPETPSSPDMSYTIAVRLLNNTDSSLSICEKTCWKYTEYCYWEEKGDDHVLCMGYSGTSGMLRFRMSDGDTFNVAVGVHNYVRWCDLDVASGRKTLTELHELYYSDEDENGRYGMLWEQSPKVEKTTEKGKKVTLRFEPENGQNMRCFVDIVEPNNNRN